jgi:hypothetical protein
MSVSSSKSSTHPVSDNKSGIQEEIWQRVELSERLCEFSAWVCEFNGQAIADLRLTCLYQREKMALQRERLTALKQKLSAQRDRLGKEEPEMSVRPLG